MLKCRALTESMSLGLHKFLKKTGKNLSMPDKKILRDRPITLTLPTIRCLGVFYKPRQIPA